jgi:hypothetical protein
MVLIIECRSSVFHRNEVAACDLSHGQTPLRLYGSLLFFDRWDLGSIDRLSEIKSESRTSQ